MDGEVTKQVCPDCGGEFKNVGSHMRFCAMRNKAQHADAPLYKTITEKPLDILISDFRQLLSRYQNKKTEITLIDQSGTWDEVELKARIRIRR